MGPRSRYAGRIPGRSRCGRVVFSLHDGNSFATLADAKAMKTMYGRTEGVYKNYKLFHVAARRQYIKIKKIKYELRAVHGRHAIASALKINTGPHTHTNTSKTDEAKMPTAAAAVWCCCRRRRGTRPRAPKTVKSDGRRPLPNDHRRRCRRRFSGVLAAATVADADDVFWYLPSGTAILVGFTPTELRLRARRLRTHRSRTRNK